MSDPLFLLIQSLTKAEKIYFRKESATFAGKENAYLSLFDAIAGQKEYDEAALRQQLAGKRFLKQLGVMKSYLYERLLESLSRFRAKEDSEAQLLQTKQAVAVLIEKKLLPAALKLLKKAIQTAIEEERFILVIQFLTLQHKILVNLQPSDLESQQQTWAQIDDSLQKFQNMQQYQRLHAAVLYWIRKDRHARSPETIEELDKIIQQPLLQADQLSQSFFAKLFFFATHEAYHKAKGSFDKALFYSNNALQLYEQQPIMQKTDAQNYLGVLINHLNTAYYTKNITLLKEGIDLFKKLKYNDPKKENMRISRYLVFRFSCMKLENNFSELAALCQEAEQYLDNIGAADISTNDKRLIMYNALHNHILAATYNQALDWRLRLNELPKTQTQSDFQRFERLLEILIHYALGNDELVLALCKNADRQLQGQWQGYESLFIAMFKTLAKTPNFERKGKFLGFLHQFETLFQQSPEEQKALDYFDILAWIRASM